MDRTGRARVVDTHAEAFAAWYARLVVTASDEHWLDAVTSALCGYGTSVIGCDAEIAVERQVTPDDTPDGRIGAEVLAFGFRAEPLGRAVANRVGQTVLTCPTAAVFDGLPSAGRRASLGDYLRYFGDGHEREATGHWLVPVMEGEVALPRTMGLGRGVAGGNLILCGREQAGTLLAARRAGDAVRGSSGGDHPLPRRCLPQRQQGRLALREARRFDERGVLPHAARIGRDEPAPKATACAYELIINGVDEQAVREAMRRRARRRGGSTTSSPSPPDLRR